VIWERIVAETDWFHGADGIDQNRDDFFVHFSPVTTGAGPPAPPLPPLPPPPPPLALPPASAVLADFPPHPAVAAMTASVRSGREPEISGGCSGENEADIMENGGRTTEARNSGQDRMAGAEGSTKTLRREAQKQRGLTRHGRKESKISESGALQRAGLGQGGRAGELM